MNTNSYPIGKRPSEQRTNKMKIIKGLEEVKGGLEKPLDPPPPTPPNSGK